MGVRLGSAGGSKLINLASDRGGFVNGARGMPVRVGVFDLDGLPNDNINLVCSSAI